MNSVGWGVIGCSDIVKRRAGAAIVEQENSRLLAFLSRNKERASTFAKEFGAERACVDLQSFLQDDRIDIVYVATEVERHADLAIAAANAGKHVLVEKPMALNTEQCLSMIETAEKNGVKLSVAYYARFFEKAQVMKRVIEEGRLGKVVRANIRVIGYYNPPPSHPHFWRVTAKAGGNRLADVGSHRLDMLSYFFGRPIKVCGFVDKLSMSYEAADTETALVQFENMAHVTVLANANVPRADNSTSIEIYGTQGTLLTDAWSEEAVKVLGSDMEPIPVSHPHNAHFPMIDDFARAIAEGHIPRFSGIDGMWATAVIQGAYESARTGKIVSIPNS